MDMNLEGGPERGIQEKLGDVRGDVIKICFMHVWSSQRINETINTGILSA